MRIGLDVGSTTLKCVVLNEQNEVLFKKYERHLSRIVEKSVEMLREVAEQFPKEKVLLSISGSAGMGLAERSDIQFVQEVYATRIAVNRLVPGTDAVIELGGEDAKILFLTDGNNASGLEVRMNGSCAGGTGAFIDQMASLMQITPLELNDLAAKAQTTRPLPRAAACLPNPTFSRFSIRAQGVRMSRQAFCARWSTRPSPGLRRGEKSRESFSISEVP